MFRHVALFRWKDDATEAQRERAADELRALPAVIEEIREFHVGVDAGVNEGNYDLAVVAVFDTPEGYLAYRDHPRHRLVADQHIRPIVAARAAVQFVC